jgi:hypothetical protein
MNRDLSIARAKECAFAGWRVLGLKQIWLVEVNLFGMHLSNEVVSSSQCFDTCGIIVEHSLKDK